MTTTCTECGKELQDPKDNPLYVVVLDAYFCDGECWDTYRGCDVIDEEKTLWEVCA